MRRLGEEWGVDLASLSVQPNTMNDASPDLIWQDDATGGKLPVSRRFDDPYFSATDGRAECEFVFLAGNGLPERWADAETFTIGELGFGTGLNLLQTWRWWRDVRQPGQQLVFQSVEAFPLDAADALTALARWPDLTKDAEALWDGGFDTPRALDNQTTLHVHHAMAADAVPQFASCDAWFLDGFSPAKNEAMWSPELMKSVFERTVQGGTFASYTAAGWVRRNLENAGFSVERCPGFGRKRHMIVGSKP
ncbi:tRNA 5-methylaminomethyl-2-thiouridine biosynthesis bifunctional protein MnmC [Ahrensia sp. R2A130]|nr:tRNA 5-methylaminomethyl-2-thiouridine biosynthesis bifunctional protein MnmC [Ahrensia sp. R2A130]